MGIGYIYPQFEVVRDWDKCTNCRICERGQPAHAPGRGHDRPGAGHPGNFPRRRIISYTEYTEV